MRVSGTDQAPATRYVSDGVLGTSPDTKPGVIPLIDSIPLVLGLPWTPAGRESRLVQGEPRPPWRESRPLGRESCPAGI